MLFIIGNSDITEEDGIQIHTTDTSQSDMSRYYMSISRVFHLLYICGEIPSGANIS